MKLITRAYLCLIGSILVLITTHITTPTLPVSIGISVAMILTSILSLLMIKNIKKHGL